MATAAASSFLSPAAKFALQSRCPSAKTAPRSVRFPPVRAQQEVKEEEPAATTQTDKLTLMLDPTEEFVWTDETCQMVYNEFQDLVDHYEGAPLSEYTLRLIGSDLEHYIRKLLYDGEIKYNMRSRVLNFSMGKPRVKFNSSQMPDVK
uniref:NAD(P)H-quinone oxidoreductase subunit M, chloroplastic n=1 Tax=Aegilops tauschii TaxID=37682 RepID=M8CME6_AEGTA